MSCGSLLRAPCPLAQMECAMPVLPRLPRFGRPACCCYTYDTKRIEKKRIEKGAPCQCCPDTSGLASRRGTVPPMTQKKNWPLDLVSHQDLLHFKETCRLSTLSSVSVRLVPPQGIAPRSAGYRPAALLLSYRGMEEEKSLRMDLHHDRRVMSPVFYY
jgi:hypothetical protein